jgi:predicted RND superfamily exporter protein
VLSTLTVLPALLVFSERWGLLRLGSLNEHQMFHVERRPYPAVRPILAVSIVLTVLAFIMLPAERFEYDFGKLEPEYVEYNRRAEDFQGVFRGDGRRNPAYILVDDPAEVSVVTAALRSKVEDDTLILAVESLQERFPPTPAATDAKLARLEDLRELIADPFLQADTTGQIARLERAAGTDKAIPLANVPRELKQPFTTKSGEIGNFIMVYPAVGLSDGRNSMAFAERVGEVTTPDGKTYYAGSTSLVAADMLRLMLDEAPWMVLLTFVLIVALMAAVFRSMVWTAVALVPLVVGVLWMLGAMWLFDVPFSFYNLVVLPAVLGIGNDCGVHIVHRYREEGRGSLRWVLRSTGEHVTMGAITTMIGFGGLLLSFHPGLRSIGLLAVIGIGTTLLAALLFLPALLQWLEDNDWITPHEPAAEHGHEAVVPRV